MESGSRDVPYPEAEWEARVELAAAYRLTDLFGMTTLVYNHITARVPGTNDQFLINEFGMGYDEITASNLVKIDLNGRVIEGGHAINIPGYIIHSAVHAARHDVNCVMHTHTPYGMAVSALEIGFKPLQQDTYGFHGDISYHEFEGIAVDVDERERLVTDLGSTNNMVLRNHGLLTLGQNVSEAWGRMWNLERACQVQVLAMSTGQPLHQAPIEAIEKTAALVGKNPAGMAWPYLLRKLDAKDPSYKT
jgi:ribulose-5-phosphate 4-epimerase/fuculose-1-phosphate aldolase